MQNLKSELLPVTPPVVISGLTLAGLTLSDFVLILTAIYTIIQIIRVLPKTYGCVRCFAINWTCDQRCKPKE